MWILSLPCNMISQDCVQYVCMSSRTCNAFLAFYVNYRTTLKYHQHLPPTQNRFCWSFTKLQNEYLMRFLNTDIGSVMDEKSPVPRVVTRVFEKQGRRSVSRSETSPPPQKKDIPLLHL
jgi:hypothetical protein